MNDLQRYSHKDNLNMKDLECENAVKESLKYFKFAGGGCVVENSTFGLHRKTSFLKELAEETGVNIIAGTGFIYLFHCLRKNFNKKFFFARILSGTKSKFIFCKFSYIRNYG